MQPQGTRVWRKSGRAALRGIPRGRRTSHKIRVTWGQQHQIAARAAAWAAFRAAGPEAGTAS
ncbi:MAG TPA: hypothetical protein VK586_03600 [Streptosporangiaceae bacterium]|nr:hypothetical protein [Streptosporangiaceae bacterium]